MRFLSLATFSPMQIHWALSSLRCSPFVSQSNIVLCVQTSFEKGDICRLLPATLTSTNKCLLVVKLGIVTLGVEMFTHTTNKPVQPNPTLEFVCWHWLHKTHADIYCTFQVHSIHKVRPPTEHSMSMLFYPNLPIEIESY